MSGKLGIISALAVLTLLPVLGGCVSEEQYKDALAANRNQRKELEDQFAKNQALTEENRDLRTNLDRSKQINDNIQQQVALLTRGNSELRTSLDQAREELKRRGVIVIRTNPLPPEIDAKLQALAAANGDVMEYDPKYGMVKFKSDLTFAPGSTDVQKSAADVLGKFVEIMNSKEAGGFNVYIAGHTDDMPVSRPETKQHHPNNWYLSVHRAITVRYVLNKAGLDDSRMCVMGFGEYHPIVPNKPNKKGEEKNRRVEIWIVPPGRFLTDAAEAVSGDSTTAPAPKGEPGGEGS
ncbi:MAG: OmpA family protein [Planctomycetes bacterium]|nr:OmpA family protein [Planctomycetota bacterium]